MTVTEHAALWRKRFTGAAASTRIKRAQLFATVILPQLPNRLYADGRYWRLSIETRADGNECARFGYRRQDGEVLVETEGASNYEAGARILGALRRMGCKVIY